MNKYLCITSYIFIAVIMVTGVCALGSFDDRSDSDGISVSELTYSEVGDETNLKSMVATNSGVSAVRLTSDITLSAVLEIKKDITIDLNGRTITCGIYNIVSSGENSHLVINDSSVNKTGVITSTNHWDGTIGISQDGRITVNAGTIENIYEYNATAISDNGQSDQEKGKITINGGIIRVPNGGVCINVPYSDLEVCGGTFEGSKENPNASFYSIGVLSGGAIEGVIRSVTGGTFVKFTDAAIQINAGDITLGDEVSFSENKSDINLTGTRPYPNPDNIVNIGKIDLTDNFSLRSQSPKIKINPEIEYIFTTENQTDLSSYFDGSQNGYVVINTENNELALVKPTITTQPTVENLVVGTNYAGNVRYQWYKHNTTSVVVDNTDASVYSDSKSYVTFDNDTEKWDIVTGESYAVNHLFALNLSDMTVGQRIDFSLPEGVAAGISVYCFASREYENATSMGSGSYSITMNTGGAGVVTLFLTNANTTAELDVRFVQITNEPIEGQTTNELTRINGSGDYYCELEYDGQLINRSNIVTVGGKTVSVTKNNDFGTVSPSTQSVIIGKNATITITPNVGYKVSAVMVGDINHIQEMNNNILTIVGIRENTNVEVTFEKMVYDITIAVNNGGYGSVNSMNVENVPHGTTWTVNENVLTLSDNKGTITATPADSDTQYTYIFDSWSAEGGTVTSNTTITAYFARLNNYSVIFASDIGATAVPGIVTHSKSNEEITLFKANYEISVSAVKMNDVDLTLSDDYTYDEETGLMTIVKIVDGPVVITADATLLTHTVVFASDIGATAVPGTVIQGKSNEKITLSMPGHEITVSAVKMNDVDLTLSDDYTYDEETGLMTIVKIVDGPVVITADATPLTYTVIFKNDGGTEISKKADYRYDETTIVPDNPSKSSDGSYYYTFAAWSPEVSVKVTEDAIYTATYTRTAIAPPSAPSSGSGGGGIKPTETIKETITKTTDPEDEETEIIISDITDSETGVTTIASTEGGKVETVIPAMTVTDYEGETKSIVDQKTIGVAIKEIQMAMKTTGITEAPIINIEVEAEDGLVIEIPAESLKDIAEKGSGITIGSDTTVVSFDTDAVSTMGLNEGTVYISVREAIPEELTNDQKDVVGNNTVISVKMVADDKIIHDFNGKAQITFPYTLKDGEDPENVIIWYIDDDGTIEQLAAKYENNAVHWEVSHFSYYTIVFESAPELVPLQKDNTLLYVGIAIAVIVATFVGAMMYIRRRQTSG